VRPGRPRYIAELISTLALATKQQVEQGRLSGFVLILIGMTLESMEHSEICKEAPGREALAEAGQLIFDIRYKENLAFHVKNREIGGNREFPCATRSMYAV
jgi:hypothetical protein